MTLQETLNQVAKVRNRVDRLEPRLVEARMELHMLIRQAQSEGASLDVIASVAGISKERVRQVLAKKR